jgi:hypothetical protein
VGSLKWWTGLGTESGECSRARVLHVSFILLLLETLNPWAPPVSAELVESSSDQDYAAGGKALRAHT